MNIPPDSWKSVAAIDVDNPQAFISWIQQYLSLDYSVATNKITKKFYSGTIINGGRVVFVDTDGKIYPFDIADEYCYDRYVGVAETSADSGAICTVVTYGVSYYIGSGWSTGTPYYISNTGFLTSIPPTIGLVKQIAVGVDTDRILIVPQMGFELI